jgi:hypothetical protein
MLGCHRSSKSIPIFHQVYDLTNSRMEAIANLYYMRHPLKSELLNYVITRPSKLWLPNTISLVIGDQYQEFTHT